MCKEHVSAIRRVLKNNVRGGLPILQCLEHSGGKLRATDLTVMVEIDTPTIADGVWNATALEFGFRDETKNTEFTSEDYPELEDTPAELEVELSGEDMGKILRAFMYVSNDQTRPVLTGVVIKGDRVYGTDGYKLYRNIISNDIGDRWVVIPTECLKVLKSAKADKRNWVFTLYDGRVAFKSGNLTVHSKLIDEIPPQYEQLINTRAYDTVAKLDMKSLHVPKGYNILIDNEEKVVKIRNEDTKDIITVSGMVKVEPVELDDTPKREIVMGLYGMESRYTGVNPMLLKQFKGEITLYIRTKDHFVEVRD